MLTNLKFYFSEVKIDKKPISLNLNGVIIVTVYE